MMTTLAAYDFSNSGSPDAKTLGKFPLSEILGEQAQRSDLLGRQGMDVAPKRVRNVARPRNPLQIGRGVVEFVTVKVVDLKRSGWPFSKKGFGNQLVHTGAGNSRTLVDADPRIATCVGVRLDDAPLSGSFLGSCPSQTPKVADFVVGHHWPPLFSGKISFIKAVLTQYAGIYHRGQSFVVGGGFTTHTCSLHQEAAAKRAAMGVNDG